MSDESVTPQELRRRIYNVLENSTAGEFALEQSWTRLGVLLSAFKAQESWRPLGYVTFDDFITELKMKFKRGRTVLYGYLSCAEVLLPIIGAEKLEQMGISKSLELKRAVKKLENKPLPPALLEAALDASKTTKELRATIGQALNLTPDEKGVWFDWGGSFLSKEERAFMKEVFSVTKALLGIKADVPEHIQRKAIFTAWAEEFYGTHSSEFYGQNSSSRNSPAVLVQSAHAIIEQADELDDCPTGPHCTESCLHGFPSHD